MVDIFVAKLYNTLKEGIKMKLAYSLGTVGVSMAAKTETNGKTKSVFNKKSLKLAKTGYNFVCCQNQY